MLYTLRILLLPLAVLPFFVMSSSAFAQCTGPDGQESQTRYDFSAHKMFFCDGTDWVEMGSAPDPAFYYCTNEQSDGDGSGDVAACVGATIIPGPARYRPISCNGVSDGDVSNATPKWNGTRWRVAIISSTDCIDGTVYVVDLQANGGGGS